MRENRRVYGAFVGKPEEKNQLEDLSLDERVILKLLLKRWDGGEGDWINVASGKCYWRAVVNPVMDNRVAENAVIFPT
jgi:hypothetical protein